MIDYQEETDKLAYVNTCFLFRNISFHIKDTSYVFEATKKKIVLSVVSYIRYAYN